MGDKSQSNINVGSRLAENLRISEPREVFTRLSEVFQLVCWNIKPQEEGFWAEVDFCPLSSQAKMMGAPSPCRSYCLDAIAEAVRGLSPESSFLVCETLWDGERCRVAIK